MDLDEVFSYLHLSPLYFYKESNTYIANEVSGITFNSYTINVKIS